MNKYLEMVLSSVTENNPTSKNGLVIHHHPLIYIFDKAHSNTTFPPTATHLKLFNTLCQSMKPSIKY